ncbi:MAG: hypothetical protein CM15mP32_1820 [Flavobacteriaceae bacterium]|nr:MAG: hypothetical protein CM15mP32_1820 [Flavobacteriaceae bacterium]
MTLQPPNFPSPPDLRIGLPYLRVGGAKCANIATALYLGLFLNRLFSFPVSNTKTKSGAHLIEEGANPK